MSNHSTRDMEEAIYRMSFVESLLVLVVIGLWLLAVISLAKKLERICNPPSIFPNYSLNKKASLSPSARRDRRSNESIQSTLPPPVNFIRATSEPAIDASPRATILVRSPSETCLHVKSTSTLRMSTNSPSALELGHNRRNHSIGSMSVPRTGSFQIRTETSHSPLTRPNFLDPKRIPSIVRRSLLDLHRRTHYSNNPPSISPIKCIVTAAGSNCSGNGPVTMTISSTTTTKVPLLKRNHRLDDEECYRGEEGEREKKRSVNNKTVRELTAAAMSYFEKKRQYTEMFSKTEYLRGYLEEKTRNQATDLYQFLKPSQRYAVQLEQFRSQMNLDYQPPLPRPPPHASW